MSTFFLIAIPVACFLILILGIVLSACVLAGRADDLIEAGSPNGAGSGSGPFSDLGSALTFEPEWKWPPS